MYKKLIQDKKVVCFDLDGTIVDTEPYFVLAFSDVLAKVNKDIFYGDVYGIPGIPLRDRWERLVKDKVIDANSNVEQLTSDTIKSFLTLIKDADMRTKEGFISLLFKLKEKELKIALTTNSARDFAMQVLQKLEIEEAFDFMIFGDEVKHLKPHPEMYSKTAGHFGVKTSEMLVFEDSLTGTEAATKAGASLVVIWDGQTAQYKFPKEAQLFITDFEGLAENLDYTAQEELEIFKKRLAEEEALKQGKSPQQPNAQI